jgi:hypothetical protein
LGSAYSKCTIPSHIQCLSLRVGELFSTHKSTRQRGGPGGAPVKRSSTVIPMAEVQIEGKPMCSDCIPKKLYLIVASLSLLALDRRTHATLNSHISRIFRVWLAGLPVFHVCVFLLFMGARYPFAYHFPST